MKAKIARITDILRRDDGISGAMHYTEQISWILFLKFLNDYEQNKADEAALKYGSYEYILNEEHRWDTWACPKDSKGKIDIKSARTGGDLIKYVNTELFPYLKSFKSTTKDPKSVKYKIGAIFEYLDNKIASGHTLREVLDIVDGLNFQSKDDLFELSVIYEDLLKGMGSDGGNSGEFYTPRALIKTMVEAINPKVGQTVYDGAIGSGGFLVQAFEHMKQQKNLTAKNWKFLQTETFFGKEKTPLAYVMGVMNMILHGIENPNIYKQNTLTANIRDIQEKDRFDIILANPPFGGKEKVQIQQNFPVRSSATELLFLQHFMKSLKVNGKAAVIVPEGVLTQTTSPFKQVKKELLENFNVHTILSLPSGVFKGYSDVKTNVVFFERQGSTNDIWYFDLIPPKKITKTNLIKYEYFEEFLRLYDEKSESENSWTINVKDIKDFDLSAKNPNKKAKKDYKTPSILIKEMERESKQLENQLKKLQSRAFKELILNKKDLKWMPLDDVVESMTSGFACNKKNEVHNGYVHLRTNNVSPHGELFLRDLVKINPTKVDHKKAELKKGDVIFNNTNSQELVGKTCIVDKDYDYAFSNHLTRLRTNEKVIPDYLAYYLNYLFKEGYFYRNCKRWIGQAGFSATKLKKVQIPVPTKENQKDIIKAIENSKEIIKEGEILLQSLLGNMREIDLSITKNIFNIS
jgi:type I restriction enzyme M protein